jgi:acid stress chaperone HdeA
MIKQTAAAAIAFAALLSGACSPSQIINTGGDTKCKDFTAQDEKKQSDEVTKMLKDKNDDVLSNAGQAGHQDLRGAPRLTPVARHGV